MPNAIKRSLTTDPNTIRKGNFSLGVSPDTGYGDTSTTDFWSAIDPPNGGYTLYRHKSSNGPSIFTPDDDADLIALVNMMGATSSTIEDTLQYIRDDDDLTLSNLKYEPIITHNLVLNIDNGYRMGYPLSGSVSYDLSNIQNDGTLTGGSSYATAGSGSIEFDGVDGYIGLGKGSINSGEIGTGDVTYTIEAWIMYVGTPGSTTLGWSIMGNASSSGIGLQIMTNGGVKVNFGYRSTSNFYSVSDLSASVWYHIVGTREVGISNRIYINGSLDSTNSSSNLSVQATSGEMQIGWANTRITGRYDGNIAIVRLYKSHLTTAEVLNNFNAQKGRFGY